eukprot:TRINITY_DN232_c0_g1_i3.p4 TRINITY_DN232_c0_g1~~TRINITY_DN232_c0_g1_i3.p4  ORF type:complete len:107 (-),score=13.16 TRINITY_DN232_c0_g1_i3:22-342(-)
MLSMRKVLCFRIYVKRISYYILEFLKTIHLLQFRKPYSRIYTCKGARRNFLGGGGGSKFFGEGRAQGAENFLGFSFKNITKRAKKDTKTPLKLQKQPKNTKNFGQN